MYIIVYVTCSSKEEAQNIGQALVEERLTACANYFPVGSIYHWQGKIEQSQEYALICKTNRKKFVKVRKRIKDMHSYQLPVVAFWKFRAERKVLKWIDESVGIPGKLIEKEA